MAKPPNGARDEEEAKIKRSIFRFHLAGPLKRREKPTMGDKIPRPVNGGPIDAETLARILHQAPAPSGSGNRRKTRVPINLEASLSVHKDVHAFTGWVGIEIEGKIVPVAIENETNTRKIEFDFKEKKLAVERTLGKMLGGARKVAIGINLETIGESIGPPPEPMLLFKAFEAKLAVEWKVDCGPLENVSGAVNIGPLPLQFSFEVMLYKHCLPKFDNDIDFKFEGQLSIGPGPKGWAKLLEKAGRPLLDFFGRLVEAGALEGLIFGGVAVVVAYELAHMPLAMKAAEEEGQLFPDCYEYAMAYSAEFFGGGLPSATSGDQASSDPQRIQKIRENARRDARSLAEKYIKTFTGAAALKLFAGHFMGKRKKDLFGARILMFNEVLTAQEKKLGVKWRPQMSPPQWL